MIKYSCDLCKEEIKDIRFFCEILKRSFQEIAQMQGQEFKIQPKVEEKHYHLCKKCFEEKLNI